MHLPLEMINISSRASLLSNPSEPLHTVVISASCPVGVLFSSSKSLQIFEVANTMLLLALVFLPLEFPYSTCCFSVSFLLIHQDPPIISPNHVKPGPSSGSHGALNFLCRALVRPALLSHEQFGRTAAPRGQRAPIPVA